MIEVVKCQTVLFQEAKACLLKLKEEHREVQNAAGETFRFTKQVLKALSDKARDQSIGRAPHWAAVAKIAELCHASRFLWGERPRNGSPDIDSYAKHGAVFSFNGEFYIAKITSKVYPGDSAHITYSVEAIAIQKKVARGITDSILARGQSLDPGDEGNIQNFIAEVNGVIRKEFE